MWKKILVGLFTLCGIFSITYSFYDQAMHAQNNGSIGDTVTMGGETFKIVMKKEGTGPNGTDELIAMLTRFTDVDVRAGITGSSAGHSDMYLANYADTFADTWLPNLTATERKMLSRTPYALDYYDDLDGVNATIPELSNANLGVEGTWWLHIGIYKIDAVYVNEDGTYHHRTYARDRRNFMPAIRFQGYMNVDYQPVYGNGLGFHQVQNNVKNGDVVGELTLLSNIGIVELALSADPSAPPGHENDYTLFQIPATAQNSPVQITTVQDLGAGDYYFQISATDNDYMFDHVPRTVEVHINVQPLATTITFDEPNQTVISIDDAVNGWSETAHATPVANDVKITYSKVGGDIGLIDIDSDNGAITYRGGNAFGKVKISATADDVPSNSVDNYLPSSVEKEIVIYRGVDGTITPDPASSDTSVPTFTANDQNIKINGVIGKINGIQGTPDNVTGGTTTYTYGINNTGNGSFFSVNPNSGEIRSNANLGVGSYTFTVTVSDKWSTKEIQVTVNVETANAEDLKFYENSSSNTVINQKTVNFTDTNVSVYATVRGSTNNNPVTYRLRAGEPTNVVDVNPNSGALTIRGSGTVVIEATKVGTSGQEDAKAYLTLTVTSASQNFIYTTDSTLSTERSKTNGHYDALVEIYAPNKTFQLYTTGNPTGSTVTYKLKNGSPSDVISIDSSGQITILNASLNTQVGRVIVEATSHDPSGNYNDKTIELPINIEKGTRSITFVEYPINVLNGTGRVMPSILCEGVLDTEGDTTIEIDPSEDSSIAWTNDGETIQYSWSGAEGKDIKVHVTKPANRNYKIAEADGTLHILGADESALTLSTPGRITYGDHFAIRSTQDDSMSTNVQYTFETDNQVFISTPQVTGNRAEFDAIGNSGNTEISIEVTRTADGELPLSKTVKIRVLPKPITIQIENKEKQRLEENPALTYADFTAQLVEWNGIRDEVNTDVLRLSTTATRTSGIGSYPITAGNAERQLNDNYPNYVFTIQEGLLNVLDNGNHDFWDNDNDGCPDVNIQITDEQGNPLTINGDRNDDGIPDYNIDKDGDGKPDLNIDTDHDGKPDLNLVILKEWKPTRCVTLGDIQYASGISDKPKINVDLDGDGIPDIDIDNAGDFKPHINIANGGDTPQVNIVKLHIWNPDKDYRKESFTYDSIGKDSEGTKPELNIDTDGDGLPDINLDIDKDGKPDLNIDWDGDWIPDTQIDSTGDGKADVNIDADGNGIADENIKEITEWKPEHNTSVKGMSYDTMKFEEVKEPEEPDKDDKSDSEIKGNYYPGTNIGGALTGDTTDLFMYIGIGCISLGLICLIIFKRKQEKC